MTRPSRHRTVVLLAATAALGGTLTGCGSSGLLPASDADQLRRSLDDAQTSFDGGRCGDASAAVRDGRERVRSLPASTDPALLRRLEDGFRNLGDRVERTCEELPATTEEAPPTTTQEAPPTETIPPPTTEQAPTTTQEAPPTTTEEAPAPPPDDGGGSGSDGSGTDQGPSGGGLDVPGDAAGRAHRAGRDAEDRARRALRARGREARRDAERRLRGLRGELGRHGGRGPR